MRPQLLLALLSFAPQFSVQLSTDDGNSVVSRGQLASTSVELPSIETRQQKAKANDKQGDSCPKCSRRKCKQNNFRDQKDCKCKTCPKGKKPNAAGDDCVDDKKEDKKTCPKGEKPNAAGDGCVKEKNDDKKKKKMKKFEETRERKKKEFPKKQKKKKKMDKYEETRQRKKKDFQRDRKRTRMGKCLLLVPLAMYGEFEGTTAVSSYAEDFFSEDFVSSEAIDGFWPGDFGDPLDVDIDNDDYTNQWVEVAAKAEDAKDDSWKPREPIGLKREVAYEASHWKNTYLNGRADDQDNRDDAVIPMKFRRRPAAVGTEATVLATTTALSTTHIEKRNPIMAVLRLILQFTTRLAGVTTRVVSRFASVGERVAVRLSNLASRGGARLAKGNGKVGADKMKSAAKKIGDSKYWKNCLNGKKPK
ncbi:hypothetical protein PG989_015399 [Apiospora arundinis]|uniref:Uncharacterized protein n=1 Tax=Apiospora arundinis TaxID=335852 RepID=A0ABR2JK57_9PEZI